MGEPTTTTIGKDPHTLPPFDEEMKTNNFNSTARNLHRPNFPPTLVFDPFGTAGNLWRAACICGAYRSNRSDMPDTFL